MLRGKLMEQSDRNKVLSAQLQQIKAEVLLREENYNKTFANGGKGSSVLAVDSALSAQDTLSNWMLSKPLRRTSSKQSRTPTSLSRTASLSLPPPSS